MTDICLSLGTLYALPLYVDFNPFTPFDTFMLFIFIIFVGFFFLCINGNDEFLNLGRVHHTPINIKWSMGFIDVRSLEGAFYIEIFVLGTFNMNIP